MKLKEILFLCSIFIFLGLAVVFLLLRLDTSSKLEKLSDNGILNVLILLDNDGKVLSTNLFSYYTENKRGAMMEIPANTAVILQSLKRTDGISAMYTESGIDAYCDEVKKFLGTEIPFQLKLTLEDFAYFVDMLGGISIFIPNSVELKSDDDIVLLPSGLIKLDGEKAVQYITYRIPEESEAEAGLRKQKAILAFLRACHEQSDFFFSPSFFKKVTARIGCNLSKKDMKNLLIQICQVDTERIVPQRVGGALKTTADGIQLLFPANDGNQIKEIIKQTLSSLASEDGTLLERVYAVEILNGTDKSGLATKTGEIFQNFGYDVANIGNAETREETVVIDRIGNANVAHIIADIISCKNIISPNRSKPDLNGTETAVDFTIILGSDFNGQYVIHKKK